MGCGRINGSAARRATSSPSLYSLTFFFHWIPGITETTSRLPPGAPLTTGPDDPRVQGAVGVAFVLFLIGATLQVKRMRRAPYPSLRLSCRADGGMLPPPGVLPGLGAPHLPLARPVNDAPAAHPSDRAREILQRVFGYAQFRGPQEAIVDHMTGGGDALVLMPTGGGKSLCYQIPALLRAGTGCRRRR